jgi:hypothetical protein
MYRKVTIVGDGILTRQGLDGVLVLNTVGGNRGISAPSGGQAVLIDERRNESGWGAVGSPSILESLFK